MIRILLDEHVSPVIGQQLQRKRPEVFVTNVQEFEGGRWLGTPDEELLTMARLEEFVVVTYDQKTFFPILKVWGDTGISHGGVIFVDYNAAHPANLGAVIRGLLKIIGDSGEEDWTDLIMFLRDIHY